MASGSALFEVKKSPAGTRILKLKSLRRFTMPTGEMFDTFIDEPSS